MPDSPGKRGWPSINSAITQPVDHTSRPSQHLRQRFGGREQISTDLCRIICGTENQFRRPVVARTDVGNIRFILDEDLGRSEITQLQNTRVQIDQEVLGLDVTMADALGVDICQGTEELVNIKLDLQHWHRRFELVEIPRRPIHRFRHILKNEIQVDFILLRNGDKAVS